MADPVLDVSGQVLVLPQSAKVTWINRGFPEPSTVDTVEHRGHILDSAARCQRSISVLRGF